MSCHSPQPHQAPALPASFTWALGMLCFHRKKELLQGVYMMGFNRPSKIQEQALPLMLAYP